MMEPMDEVADRTMDFLKESLAKSPDGILDMKSIVPGFTVDTLTRCAFGLDTNAHKGENSDFSEMAYDVFGSFRANTIPNMLFFNFIAHLPFIGKLFPFWPESGNRYSTDLHYRNFTIKNHAT